MAYPFATTLPPTTACDIAIAALARQGQYGVVTNLANEHEISRQKVYELRNQARAVVEGDFAHEADASPGTLSLTVTDEDIKRTVIALRVVTPSSIRDEVALLPIIYRTGWSFGKIQAILADAARRADVFLSAVDLAVIKHIALDEMFSQGLPVFGGIDLDTQYLFQLEVHRSRGGEDWEKSLSRLRDNQNLHPNTVVKDAGTGLAKGVRDCWPKIQENDDVFHAVYMMGREAYHLERRAYSMIAKEYELEIKRQKAQTETSRRSLGQRLRKAQERSRQAVDRFDCFEALRYEAKRVLELADPGSGCLRTSSQVQETLTRVAIEMRKLGGSRISKVARYVENRAEGLARYLDDLNQRLQDATEAAGGTEILEAAVRAYQASMSAGRKGPAWEKKEAKRELSEAVDHLLSATDDDPERIQRAMSVVVSVLGKRYRASSAIENLNSVLRPYLVVQKNVRPGFLNLFRFYWNTRQREWGPGKDTSPYEALTGERVEDWLTLLGYPPSEAFATAA